MRATWPRPAAAEESIAEAARAAELDPMSASAASTRAMVLYYARDYQGALGAIGHALQLEPGSASAYFVLSRIDAARGAIERGGRRQRAGVGHCRRWRVERLAGRT